MKPKVRFSVLITSLLVLILGGTLGYRILLDAGWMDSFYMTMITVSTVGYGEIGTMNDAARLFSVFLIVCSLGVVGYIFSSLMSYFFEGDLQENWRRRKRREQMENLNQHYIVCGYGQTGQIVVEELQNNKQPFIVIDNDPESISLLEQRKILYLEGDATQEEILEEAGIKKAKGLVSSLTKDSENLFVVLTARELNPELTIIAKAIHHSAHQKLKRAGATNTVSPTEIGGHRIASMLLRPAVIAFLDTLTRAGEIELDLEDVVLEEGSSLCGLQLREAQIPQKTGLIILAIEQKDKEMIFNPTSDCILDPGDHLFALGRPEQIDKLREIAAKR